MLISPRRRTFRPPLALSLTTTVCDEARGKSPNVTDDDQPHVSHRSSRSVRVRDSRLLRTLREPVLPSLLGTSDMRQISTSVPVQIKYLSQTLSHRTVQPLVFPIIILRTIAG